MARNRSQWRITPGTPKRGSWRHLEDVAQALGVPYEGGERLDLRIDGRSVRFQLVVQDTDTDVQPRGTRWRRVVTGLELIVYFEGAPPGRDDDASILLRREEEDDVLQKEHGIAKEVQLGFPGFDRAVYIDNDSTEADVRRILSKEATRQAVRRLLDEDCRALRISPRALTAKFVPRGEPYDAAPLLDALEDLLIASRAGGQRDPAPKRRGELLFTTLGLAALGLGTYGGFAMSSWPTTWALWLLGGAAGAVAAFFTRPFIVDAIRGDSGSHRRAGFAVLCTFAAATGLTTGALAHANAAYDDSEPTEWTGVVVEVSERGTTSDSSNSVTIRWRDGSTQSMTVRDVPRVGARVTELRRAGALGFEWLEERRFSSGRGD